MFSLIGFTVAAVSGLSALSSKNWDLPFQGKVYNSVPVGAEPLPKSACDGDEFNKCTFDVQLDFDRDGKTDRARLMNANREGIIVVVFGASGKQPIVVASFKSRFEGHEFISATRGRRDSIDLVHPESSSAEIRLIAGKPMIHWTGD